MRSVMSELQDLSSFLFIHPHIHCHLSIYFQRGDKMTVEEVQEIIDEVDENKDGKLNYKEVSNKIIKYSKRFYKPEKSMHRSKHFSTFAVGLDFNVLIIFSFFFCFLVAILLYSLFSDAFNSNIQCPVSAILSYS